MSLDTILKEISSIVPPSNAEHAAKTNPNFTYRGGPLLANVQVFPIFWGDAWKTDQTLQLLAQTLYVFFLDILESQLIDQLKEYSVPNYQIDYGSVPGTLTLPHNFKYHFTSDKDIQQMIQSQVASNVLPQPNANLLYFVFTPPNVEVQKGIGLSCLTFCGYHDKLPSSGYYAVIPYPSCSPCLNGLSVQDAITSIASHELCESITDPNPGTGWYDNAHGEIGDACSWQDKKLPDSNYLLQKEWSNAQNTCK